MTAFTDQYSLPNIDIGQLSIEHIANSSGHIGRYCFQIHAQHYFKYFYHRPVNVYLRFKIAG